ncbi:MAG: hypothetical protein EBU81_02565 [Proteobacteria bacterium]|nr:hypothetical protein [Pseudomonadota bacterium]
MDANDSGAESIRATLSSWETLNASLKSAIDRQDWPEVDSLQGLKTDCQNSLESLLALPESLSPEQRFRLRELLEQEKAIGEQLLGVRTHLEAEQRRWETHRKQSQQLRSSYGARPPGESLWQHFT